MAVDPLVTAAGIQAAGSLAGGLLGNNSPNVDYRGAKKGIRWRVRDAKAAGIHPLYALGAPGIGSAVTTYPGGPSPAGLAAEGVANAAASVYKAKARTDDPLISAQISASQAQAKRDTAQADLFESEAARIRQGHGVTTAGAQGPYVAPYYDQVMPDGSVRRRTSPESAMDTGEVLGSHIDDWLHNPDRRRMIEQKVYNFFRQGVEKQRINNPGRKAANLMKRWYREIQRRANSDKRWR